MEEEALGSNAAPPRPPARAKRPDLGEPAPSTATIGAEGSGSSDDEDQQNGSTAEAATTSEDEGDSTEETDPSLPGNGAAASLSQQVKGTADSASAREPASPSSARSKLQGGDGAKDSPGTASRLLGIASRAFQKRPATLETPQSANMVGSFDEACSFSRTVDAVTLVGRKMPISSGAACGYLYRSFTMLHKSERLYYILDAPHQSLFEFTDMPSPGKPAAPRTTIQLGNARLEDEIVCLRSSGGVLYSWKLFARSEAADGPLKTYTLGSSAMLHANSWLDAFRQVVGSTLSRRETSSSKSDAGEPASADDGSASNLSREVRSATPVPRESGRGPRSVGAASTETADVPGRSFTPPESPNRAKQEWHQDVMIHGKMYRIPCTGISTNAWLLSEAIRSYIRRNGKEPNPELTGLYNTSQHRLVDLADDVRQSVALGDVLEAICTEPVEAPTRRGNATTDWAPRRIGADGSRRARHESGTAASTASLRSLAELVDPLQLRAAIVASSQQFLDNRETLGEQLITQLELLCQALTNAVPFWPSEAWRMVSMENGVRIYRKAAQGREHGVLGMITAPASPQMVLSKLLDARAQHEWDPFVASARYLEVSDSSDVVHFETKRSLVQRAKVPLLNPRDFCVSRFWAKLTDGTYIVMLAPSEHPCCPPAEPLVPQLGAVLPHQVRGKLLGAYALRPSRESQRGYDECLIVSLCHMDIDSPVARRFANEQVQVAATSTLAGLREACSASS